MMAYGKDMPETPHGPKILHKARREQQVPDVDPLDDCKSQNRIIWNNANYNNVFFFKYRFVIAFNWTARSSKGIIISKKYDLLYSRFA